ncbi:ComEC/Rec2 family competence protein [Dongia sp.]|uniref:ComEC/Rec2 family competence protein n=1 Tax=Dongia sp. TaxID=1977262 RepID=UPI0035ADD364
MADYFEIDFLDVETTKSGDAIALRYSVGGQVQIHVVDGGYVDTGSSLAAHIRAHYGNPGIIDRVIVTHPDGDHVNGLRTILEEFQVRQLWMLRPWEYAAELLPRFARFNNVENLKARLKEIYPYIATLEDIAKAKGIPIGEPFQGTLLGPFAVLAPTRARYLDLIVESDKTPEATKELFEAAAAAIAELGAKVVAKVTLKLSDWGLEIFSPEETSAENEMSVVQYANICEQKILLTGDAGRGALAEAAAYAPVVGLNLPGINRFQVPHHGSRRNVSSALLDQWVGPKLANKIEPGQGTFSAIISSAKADPDHPRKAVVRALMHRGANLYTTEGKTVCSYKDSPARAGWSAVTPEAYPDDQEE